MKARAVANRNSISFFLARMGEHDRVVGNPIVLGPGLFQLKRRELTDLKVFYSGTYLFSLADIDLLPKEIGKGAFVLIQEHCAYDEDAAAALRSKRVGIGKVSDLMGAINRPEAWTYAPKRP